MKNNTKPTSNEAKNGNKSKPLLSSRLFKFRAWDFKNNKWLLGYEYPNLGGFDMFGECVLMDEWALTAITKLFFYSNLENN